MTARAGLSILAVLGLVAAVPATAPSSGLDLGALDRRVRPQDDFYRFANGRWIDGAEISPDRVTAGTFIDIFDRTEQDLHAVLEAASGAHARRGTPVQQIGDLYGSFMDEARVAALGWTPIRAELARIDGLRTLTDVAREAGYLSSISGGGPFGISLLVDAEAPDRFIVQVTQGGLLLPNREYYLSDAAPMPDIRARYLEYLTGIFELVGRADAADRARMVLEVETAIARVQLPPVESRDAARAAGVFAIADLPAAMPGFDWATWAHAQNIDRIGRIAFAQRQFFTRFAALVPTFPVAAWQAYLSARHIYTLSTCLSPPFADARFALFNRLINGQTEPRPRWKIGVNIVNAFLLDALGRRYVEERFPRPVKERADNLVQRVMAAYRDAVAGAKWLSPKTKAEAIAKLSRLKVRIGYPEHWRDYAGLDIRRDDLVGNFFRGQKFDTDYRAERSRGGGDASEWTVGAQSVNAYYVPGRNELVLPAALLQPPLFDVEADAAVNFGAIGSLIGHEISHAFDDRGRRYDASGDLRRWWTPAEEREYQRRLQPLVSQFSGYTPLPGQRVNGDLTFAENAADLEGLVVAYRAYLLSLGGGEAPVLDGFTGAQRFLLGYARMWRTKVRDDYMRQWLLTFAYAPYPYRTNGALANLDVFYDAFQVQPDDRMFRAAGNRAHLW